MLVREIFQEAPIFQRADYLSIPQMQDGQSLNSLLQNYWMVIHPPVLFLGFSSTLIPFAFAFSGLWKKEYGSWTKTALPWTLFSCCVLGTGIMMGAAWAYESLTFGGYWAWDPVENASLVPWLVLIAGLHTQVIYNSTGHSLRATYLFLILGFTLILYSTFLTRSGVLGYFCSCIRGIRNEPATVVINHCFLFRPSFLFYQIQDDSACGQRRKYLVQGILDVHRRIGYFFIGHFYYDRHLTTGHQ
jgi:cytochrome c biogenesis factor